MSEPEEIPPIEVLEAEVHHLLGLMERELKRLEKLRGVREADLAKHEKGLGAKVFGDLIKQNMGELKRGLESVVLTGFDEEGAEVTLEVPLSPTLSPKENMQQHFKSYQKGVKGVAKAGAKLSETQSSIDGIRQLANDFEAAFEVGDPESLRDLLNSKIANRLQKAERIKELSKGKGKGKSTQQPRGPFADLPSSLRPRVFSSLEGWTILCGRGARGNDWLSTRIANGNDWFFHIAGFPGAHVILRNQKGQNPPLETMLDCAQLCLYYSKMKNAQSASVHYAQAKFVKKPKGAKPGLVLVSGGKNLSVRREPERLSRLLGRDVE